MSGFSSSAPYDMGAERDIGRPPLQRRDARKPSTQRKNPMENPMDKIPKRDDGVQLSFACIPADQRGELTGIPPATAAATGVDELSEHLADLRDRLRARGGAG